MTRVTDTLQLVARLFFFSIRALVARLFRGPLRPSWGWRLEAVVGFQKATYSMIPRVGPARYNAAIQAILPPLDTDDVSVEEYDGEVPGTWLVPPDPGAATIVYLHGGGYVYGSLSSHGPMIAQIARRASARTLVPDYRLAPEHPFPAALDDACTVYRDLIANGTAPENIVLAGDSAGGGLILALLLHLRDEQEPLPACAVAISPWVDLACTDESFVTNAPYDGVSREACLTCATAYVGSTDSHNPLVSPLFANLAGLPPLLVHAGEAEVLVDQIVRFADAAKAAGVDVELDVRADMMHVWHMLWDFTPEAAISLDAIAAFVRTHVA